MHRKRDMKQTKNIKRITWQDKLNYNTTKSLDSFHQTRFNFMVTWKMAAVYFLLYFVIGLIIMKIRQHMGLVQPTGTIMIINFICLALIPMTFVGSLFGLKYHYTDVMHHFFTDFYLNCKRWVLRFWHDAWSHKWLILSSVVLLLISEVIVNKAVAAWFFHGVSMPTTNNKIIEKLIRQNRLIILASTIISPIAEELIFRFWMTDAFYDVVEHFWHGHFSKFVYWAGAILSALFFTSEHLQGQVPIKGAAYLLSALVFQWLAHRTHSLTAPVLVHSISNFIVAIPMFM